MFGYCSCSAVSQVNFVQATSSVEECDATAAK
jgi:hypothetical protein